MTGADIPKAGQAVNNPIAVSVYQVRTLAPGVEFDNTVWVVGTEIEVSESTRFVLDLTTPAQVRVELYSMSGRRVLTMPERSFQAGPNQYLTINSGRLPAGVYVYRLESSGPIGIARSTGTLTIIY